MAYRTVEEQKRESDKIEKLMNEASVKATKERAAKGELSKQQISNVLKYKRYSTSDRAEIIEKQSAATGKPVEVTEQEYETFNKELNTYAAAEKERSLAAEKAEMESNKMQISPDEAYDAGLISQRERDRGRREELQYETSPENLQLSKQYKSELKTRYPEAQVSPGITPYMKLEALDTDRSTRIKNIAANPIVRASYIFDADTLGFGTVSEAAVSGLTGQDWETKREGMMVSYAEDLFSRDNALEAGTYAALKTGAVTTLLASTGGFGVGGAAGAKIAVAGSTVVKYTYGAGLGLQYGQTIKTVMDPNATGTMKAEEVARSFVYTAPAAVAGVSKFTKPLAVKTVQKIQTYEPKTMRGMAGAGRKTGTKQQTKTKTTTKAAEKKAKEVNRARQALMEGKAKVIKVQTKQGLKDRVVWKAKTSNEKVIDRMFRKMVKDHKASKRTAKDHKASKRTIYVDKQTFQDMQRLGLVDAKGQRIKSKVDIKKFFDSKDKMYNQQAAGRFHKQTYGKDAFETSKSPDLLRPVDHEKIQPKTQGNWWKKQVAGRERVLKKQKIKRVEYEKMKAREVAKEKLDLKVMEAVDQRDMAKDLGALTATIYQLDVGTKEKTKEKVKDAFMVMPAMKLDQDMAMDTGQLMKQDSATVQVQETAQAMDTAVATVQVQETAQAMDTAVVETGTPGFGRGGGLRPGPPPPEPAPAPNPFEELMPRDRRRQPPPERLPKPPTDSIPVHFKIPYFELPEQGKRTGMIKNIKGFSFKHFYTPSLVGATEMIRPVKQPPFLAAKGFGFRPKVMGWLTADSDKKKRKKRRKR